MHTTVTIAADHPSLPGHFPGRPLVAGVILLQHVAAALRSGHSMRLVKVIEAKFVAPLLPGEPARLALVQTAPGRVKFEFRRDDTVLARGLVEGAMIEGTT
jgi:3-hydroxyacyl-[acyl-carrier-protein] dehydratase